MSEYQVLMKEICVEQEWDFTEFTMLRIEEDFECDDPRAGER